MRRYTGMTGESPDPNRDAAPHGGDMQTGYLDYDLLLAGSRKK